MKKLLYVVCVNGEAKYIHANSLKNAGRGIMRRILRQVGKANITDIKAIAPRPGLYSMPGMGREG